MFLLNKPLRFPLKFRKHNYFPKLLTTCPLYYFALSPSQSQTEAQVNISKRGELKNTELIMERLRRSVERSRELEKLLIDASLGEAKVQVNQDRTRKELNKMAPLVSIHEQLTTTLKTLTELKQLLSQSQSKQQKQLITDQITQMQKKKQQLRQQSIKLLIPPDLYDDCEQVVLEFRSGAGGSESCLFVEDFSGMVLGFCEAMGWRTQVLSAVKDTNINRGYRSFSAKVMGNDVYKILKCQSGVHKVIRVPETEAKGRLHSSTISMVVMPSVPFDFSINEKDIRYEYMRGSGPGGQSVNKTQSACRVTHIPTGLSVFNQQDRSQDRNRKRATQILKQKLFQIQYKKNIEQQTKQRRSQVTSMDRSQKICTYNYPQDRITDHRTGLTLYGMENMMSGDYLQKFIEAYQEKMFNEKLEMLLQDLKKDTGKNKPAN